MRKSKALRAAVGRCSFSAPCRRELADEQHVLGGGRLAAAAGKGESDAKAAAVRRPGELQARGGELPETRPVGGTSGGRRRRARSRVGRFHFGVGIVIALGAVWR